MYNIVSVNKSNIYRHPQAVCFINPKNENYKLKLNWLKKRFDEGLIIKLIYQDGEKRAAGFIEYTPGKYAWRAVSADKYFFINCIWVYSTEKKNKGIGSILIKDCLKDAEEKGYSGVAIVTSEGSFMTGRDLFIKNGFTLADTRKPSFSLYVKKLNNSADPSFNDIEKSLNKYKGLNIVYSKQCPWVAKSIQELKRISAAEGLNIKFKELKTAFEAQQAPSVYSTFTFLNNRETLADHYISNTRFMNILRELKDV